LITITPEMLDAEAASPQCLASLLQIRVPAEWPDSNWEPHVFTLIKQQYAEHPHTLGWHRYVVLAGKAPVLIGAAGAFPKPWQVAEIGYAILRPWQGNGYATEASNAVIEQVFADGALSVVAHTYPHLPESIRVMERCGLQYESPGEEEGSVRYRRARLD
jgi:ribosomal-protein-alanine N-acetyltransferase